MDEHRQHVVAKVRQGLATMRPLLDRSGITVAEMREDGSPSAAFAQMAHVFRKEAGRQGGASGAAYHSDAESLEMIALLCENNDVRWDEIVL